MGRIPSTRVGEGKGPNEATIQSFKESMQEKKYEKKRKMAKQEFLIRRFYRSTYAGKQESEPKAKFKYTTTGHTASTPILPSRSNPRKGKKGSSGSYPHPSSSSTSSSSSSSKKRASRLSNWVQSSTDARDEEKYGEMRSESGRPYIPSLVRKVKVKTTIPPSNKLPYLVHPEDKLVGDVFYDERKGMTELHERLSKQTSRFLLHHSRSSSTGGVGDGSTTSRPSFTLPSPSLSFSKGDAFVKELGSSLREQVKSLPISSVSELGAVYLDTLDSFSTLTRPYCRVRSNLIRRLSEGMRHVWEGLLFQMNQIEGEKYELRKEMEDKERKYLEESTMAHGGDDGEGGGLNEVEVDEEGNINYKAQCAKLIRLYNGARERLNQHEKEHEMEKKKTDSIMKALQMENERYEVGMEIVDIARQCKVIASEKDTILSNPSLSSIAREKEGVGKKGNMMEAAGNREREADGGEDEVKETLQEPKESKKEELSKEEEKEEEEEEEAKEEKGDSTSADNSERRSTPENRGVEFGCFQVEQFERKNDELFITLQTLREQAKKFKGEVSCLIVVEMVVVLLCVAIPCYPRCIGNDISIVHPLSLSLSLFLSVLVPLPSHSPLPQYRRRTRSGSHPL